MPQTRLVSNGALGLRVTLTRSTYATSWGREAQTQTQLQAMLASATNQVFLDFLVLRHSQITDLKLVNNTQPVSRADGKYSPFPFTIGVSPGDGSRPPTIDIKVDVVDQRVLLAIRQTSGMRERITIEWARATAQEPDSVLASAVFLYDSASTNGFTTMTIRGSTLRSALNDAFPAHQFAPSNARL